MSVSKLRVDNFYTAMVTSVIIYKGQYEIVGVGGGLNLIFHLMKKARCSQALLIISLDPSLY